jgi:hypothetical protein
VDTSALIAEQAYISDNRLFIQFRHRSDTINSFAILKRPDQTPAPGPSSTPYQQHAVEKYNNLPLVHLSYLDPEQWIEHTYESQAVPVAGAALWREFRDRLLAGITPRKHGSGIVVEFLKQEELFFYYDNRGLLRSVPVHDKPAGLRTGSICKFSELLADGKPLLSEYISAARGSGARALLFNTGDSADFGYPFIYANRDRGQVVFLRRLPENRECCDPSTALLADALVHTTRSHID